MSNDRINAHELSTGVDVWNRCIDEVAKLNGKCIPSVPSGLHPNTQKLVTEFCTELAEKLYKAQLKYGHSDNWSYANWEIECQTAFHEHIAKGDPATLPRTAHLCGITAGEPRSSVENRSCQMRSSM